MDNNKLEKQKDITINKPAKNEFLEKEISHTICSRSEECPEFNWTTDSVELLKDIKFLLKEYYVATFTDSNNALKIKFNNGQSFILSLNEEKY